MNRKPSVRNVGTVCVGTVLLGLGCTQRDEQRAEQGKSFDEPPSPQRDAHSQNTDLPRPQFGPLARKVIDERPVEPIAEPSIRLIPPVAQDPATEPRKASPRKELLGTTSDTTIASIDEPVPPAAPVTDQPMIAANDRTPLLELPTTETPASEPVTEKTSEPSGDPASDSASGRLVVSFGFKENPPAPRTNETSESEPTGESSASLAEQRQSSEPIPTPAPPPADTTARNEEPAELVTPNEPVKSDQPAELAYVDPAAPEIPLVTADAEIKPVLADEEAPPQPAPAPAEQQATGSQIAPDPQPPPPSVNKPAPAPVPPRVQEPVAAQSEIEYEPEPVQLLPPTPTQAAAPTSEQAGTSGEPSYTPARRSIPPRVAQSDAGNGVGATDTKLPSLTSMVPPDRATFAMSSVAPAQPDTATMEPANDAAETAPTPSPANTALVPRARGETTLGLGQPKPANTAQTTQLTDNNDSVFTASAQPPVLSYQDELILEVRIKGVEAADTILAYGTRTGVYLPLGTLARILDVAITVSDDGHYANGWVLDEDRTVTINLRAGTLDAGGKQAKLAPDTAVAFEGELYFRADRMNLVMPLTVETSLRAQAVTLETLEPFPFEERMRREAERRRLASRGVRSNQREWPREDTPYRAASLPLADVEIRALSDSGIGPRLESDVFLAGDIGFLTAEAFLGGDSIDGLTTSLVQLGRMDPDGDLLGPLQATAFSAGDVATVSMPIGLRGVQGRGFVATNTPAESVSVFERIDLRGILPDGYEVELYRNEILVASTRESVNGQYEFLQIPVDFGLNVFRLVFFGPQGQRSEQVRKISVGDGRLSPGKLVYRIGAVQKDENVFGVRSPRFIAPSDFGTWRASAEVAYGLSSDITTVVSGAWFETETDDRWVASAGIRTGIGGFAVKGDVAASKGNAYAFSAGVGGKIGGSAVTLSHVEYSGNFIDETRSLAGDFLRRSTELDLNTTINLGNPVTGLIVPVTARARHLETATGRKQTNVAVRASARLSGLLASNTLEYTRSTIPQAETFSRLFGNFDLATVGRAKTRGRLSLGYQVLPDPEILTAGIEVDHAIDENTAIRGSVGYAFQTKSTQVGLSAVRDFERFTLALDGSYGFDTKSYSVGLRLGFSFGRDPLRGNFFVARPGLASSGGASVRAFRDMDGDGVFGPTDSVLPEVDIVAFNQTVATDEDGIARLSGLGRGRGVSIQVDSTSLPDIDLAPAKEGVEIVPRAGRIHPTEFPIIALSEVEGNVSFLQNGSSKGVSGVRLQLRGAKGEVASYAKTEIDGYFFFERVKPGTYTIALDPGQSQRLNLCMSDQQQVSIGYEPDLIKQDIEIGVCDAVPVAAQ